MVGVLSFTGFEGEKACVADNSYILNNRLVRQALVTQVNVIECCGANVTHDKILL